MWRLSCTVTAAPPEAVVECKIQDCFISQFIRPETDCLAHREWGWEREESPAPRQPGG